MNRVGQSAPKPAPTMLETNYGIVWITADMNRPAADRMTKTTISLTFSTVCYE